ncbi:P-loop NTPase fold protein [Nonomuraea sp. KM90]|uniref:P-loop NTPase fold protein n=1 Tax=Nonomuraea sp. KM90 TaxID=3457428 RepID=UPI003FCD4996
MDDLDRCDGEQITALLEALKLHFNRDNCVFFLAVAKEPLISAVRSKYQDMPVDNYLDKIVQFPFEMPRLPDPAFHDYLDSLLREQIRPARDLLAIGLPRNPRTVKRFVNVLILQDRVARARGLADYDLCILAAVLLIRDADKDFYDRLSGDSTLLNRIAEDLETASTDQLPDWNPLPLGIVRCLLGMKRAVPGDVSSYIDLVKASPLPRQSDEVAPEESLPRDPVSGAVPSSVFLERLGRRVDLVVGEEGELLPSLARVGPEPQARRVTPEEVMGLWRNEGLLLTGARGSGKTTFCARIIRRLLAQGGATPVYLPVRSLRERSGTLELRLTHAVVDQYRLSLSEAFSLVIRENVLCVLDGLDELPSPSARASLVQELLMWQGQTGTRVIVTDTGRIAHDRLVRGGFTVVELLGVPEEDAAARLRRHLTAHGADYGRLRLPEGFIRSPEALAMLLASSSWIDDLPPDPVDFIPWYVNRALRRCATEEFTADQLAEALRGLARDPKHGPGETFSSEAAGVRSVFRQSGLRGIEVTGALRALVEAGLLKEAGEDTYRFCHELILEHFARRSPA